MSPIVYVDLLSPPAQSIPLAMRAAGLDSTVQIKEISLATGDHRKPDFVKKFPMHTVPSMEDDGFYLWDSHAICTYLLSSYAKDDKLYPKDPKKRAKVDQWLHFSNSILYTRLRDMSEPLWLGKRKDVPAEKKERVAAALTDMQTMMGDNKWLCGDELTLADVCCVCEVLGFTAAFGDISEFKIVTAWLERCRAALPGFQEIVTEGNEKYKVILKKFMS